MELVARFLFKNGFWPHPRGLAAHGGAHDPRDHGSVPGRATVCIKPRTIRTAQRLSIIAACLAMMISAVALSGWAFHTRPLKVQSAIVAMNPVSACCFILASVSLLLLHRNHSGKIRIRLGVVVAIAVLAIGALKLFSLWFHWNINIDGWLFPVELAEHPDVAAQFASRTACAFVLVGGALLLRTAHAWRFAEILSFFVVAIGALSLQGYAFGLLEFHRFANYVPMSALSALCVTLVGISMLLAQTERGAMGLIASDSAGGLLARRLLPMAIILPIVLGALRLGGENAGWYDTKLGLALFSTAFIVLFLVVVWWTARLLHRLDLKRRAAESASQESDERVRRLNLELEQRVTERTLALETANAANQDLEAFSYSVSHDLRAPLRAISGFSRIVLEDHAAALDADGLRYLHVVEKSAQQMGQLIDDLLTFSRTGRQALTVRPVSTTDIVNACLTDLQGMQENRHVTITVGALPDCEADASLLRQVWLNLLANALKYTRKRDPAVITIGSRREGGTDSYFVQDNGAGFDMKYVDKLFGVFQRLHLADDYEGTGVGLALVQRIVQRHGGRIWTEAKLNVGATFHFTLTGGQHV